MYSSHQSEDSNSDQSSSSLISSFNLTSASLANEDRKSKRKIEIKISKSDSQEEEPAPIKSHQVLNKNQDQESDLEQIVKRPKKTEFSEEVSDSDLADAKFPENTFDAKITNSDGNSTVIVPKKVSDPAVFWVNDLPPQDQALSIDLIFDEILKNLDPSTLKTCRLVSRHWHSIVSKKLEKSTRIRIYTEQDYDSELYSFGFIKKLLTPTGFPLNQMEPFRNLKSILNENQNLFSNFPCSHFVFFKTNLSSGDSEIRQFFINYGHLVKTLEINLFYLNSINFQDLKTDINFIFENCLNLEDLAVSSNITEITAQNIDSESLKGEKDNEETPHLFSNLKKLKLQTVFPQKLIDLLTDPSRFGGNLLEVAVHSKNLLFFLKTENLNKIYLLKTMDFIPTMENLPIYEKVSFEKKLKLQKFAFSLTWISSQKTKNLWPRVTGILSRILEYSQDTLTEITWDSTRYLIEEQGAVFKIPANFKNVQKLNFFIGNLGIPPAMGHEPSNTNSKQFFLPQFQIAQHFPALKEIQLINGRPICEFHFDKYFELTVVGSVRKFKIPDWKFYDPYSCGKFREMFPNVPGHRNNAA